MSFFNKAFASIGIGSASIDTKLEKDTVMAGENVKGIVEIKGGKVEQKVDEIYLSLHTTYIKESDDKKFTVSACIDRFKLTDAFTVNPGEFKGIPFNFRLPQDTPVSLGRTKIWVQTGLDIKNAVDPSDKDFINVTPNPLMSAVFSAAEDLGFRMREAECQEAPHRLRRRMPFVQEFEFVPVSGQYRGRLDELEVVFFPEPNGMTDIMLQVDRRARGLGGFFSEAMSTDETNVRLTVSPADIPSIRQKLESILQAYS